MQAAGIMIELSEPMNQGEQQRVSKFRPTLATQATKVQPIFNRNEPWKGKSNITVHIYAPSQPNNEETPSSCLVSHFSEYTTIHVLYMCMLPDMLELSQNHWSEKLLCRVSTCGKRASAALSWTGITLSKCSPQCHEPTGMIQEALLMWRYQVFWG